jgi:hypothetical protein
MTQTELNKLSLTELKMLKTKVQDTINYRVSESVNQLKTGDIVKVNHNSATGQKFTIMKINRKRCKIQNIKDKKIFNCDFGLIEKI